MNIGDIFFALRGDGSTLMVDAQKAANAAGAAAGQTLSQRISAGLGKGLGPAAFAGLAVGAVGAYASVQGIVNILGEAKDAALAEEDSIVKLGTSLKANVPAWDGNTAAIERVLKARMALGFTDEEQRQALALTVAATHDVNQALKVQATAMDLARFKGISLQDATLALTRVEAGSYRILAQLGIQLPKNATSTQALAAVQKVAAGQAASYAETNSGKLLKSQVEIDEAMEKFGAVTLPVVVAATQLAADTATTLADHIGDIGDALNGLGNIVGSRDALGDLGRGLDVTLYMATHAGDASGYFIQKAKEMAAAAQAAAHEALQVRKDLDQSQPAIDAAAGRVASALPVAIEAQVPRTRQAMLDLLHAAAKGVSDGRKNLDDEIAALNDLVKKPDIGPTTELERLLKARTSPTLIALLTSKDKEKRLAARALAADLDEAIALAKPRDGIMSATSKALIADLMKSTNPELRAFAGWFQNQLAPIVEGGTVRIDPTGKKRSILPGTVDQAAAAKSLHDFMSGALKSADPFIQNDAKAEGQNFVAALSAEIESARSKRAAQLALEGLFAGVHIALNLGQIIDLVAGANVPTGTGHAEGKGPLRDSGGPVWAGFPFLKATRQAEVYVPGESGSILTLDQLKGMGGRPITIENVNLVDAHDEFSVMQSLQFLAAVQ